MYNDLLLISIVFFFSSCLQGITGFGFSLLSVPLLSLVLAPKIFVPILIMYSIVINSTVILSAIKEIRFKDMLLLFPFTFVGIPLGVHILKNFPRSNLQLLIGTIVIIFVIYQLIGKIKIKANRKYMYLIAGFFSGILGGSISMSGPPVIMLFSNQRRGKHNFRVNLAVYFLILNIITTAVYLINKMITIDVLNRSVLYFLPMFLGVIIGNVLSHKIPEKGFRKVTLILMLFMGILTLLSGLI